MDGCLDATLQLETGNISGITNEEYCEKMRSIGAPLLFDANSRDADMMFHDVMYAGWFWGVECAFDFLTNIKERGKLTQEDGEQRIGLFREKAKAAAREIVVRHLEEK